MRQKLTSGSVLKAILQFALPYFLSYFLQTLYGMADLFIIGQFNGVDGITAVSNGSQVMYMITVVIVGLAMGATVRIGQAAGANKIMDIQENIGTTISFFMFLSVIFMLGLLAVVNPIVVWLKIPEKAAEGTVWYLTVCFIGIPFITAYNIISSIFRGMGDSKSPMYFIGIACILNIALDYLFIGGLKMGPTGAALGTTLSQTFSVWIAFVVMKKRSMGIKLTKQNFRIKKAILKPILNIGIPVAVQDGCIQIAFILITIIANHRGLNDAAAVGIVEKVIGMFFIVPSSMLATVSALSAQNIGAGKYDRARKILKYAIGITCGYGVIIAFFMQGVAATVVACFTTDKMVILLGSQYLRGYIWDCIFAGIHFCFSGYFCAYEKSYIGFLHNILSILLVRIPGAWLASAQFKDTLFPMGLAAPAGSVLSVLICIGAYRILFGKKDKESYCKKNHLVV